MLATIGVVVQQLDPISHNLSINFNFRIGMKWNKGLGLSPSVLGGSTL
jgi:hypothetical protein